MTIDPALLVLLSALLSAGSAIVATYLTNRHNFRITRLTKESEERKHQKELVFNAAIENWKQTYELTKARGGNTSLMPLDVFLVHMIALSDALFDPSLNADNIKERLAEVDRLTDIVMSTRKDAAERWPTT